MLFPAGGPSGSGRVAFGVVPSAGMLTITVVADAGFADELDARVGPLRAELDAVTAATGPDR